MTRISYRRDLDFGSLANRKLADGRDLPRNKISESLARGG
jgi:hypothetical protein